VQSDGSFWVERSREKVAVTKHVTLRDIVRYLMKKQQQQLPMLAGKDVVKSDAAKTLPKSPPIQPYSKVPRHARESLSLEFRPSSLERMDSELSGASSQVSLHPSDRGPSLDSFPEQQPKQQPTIILALPPGLESLLKQQPQFFAHLGGGICSSSTCGTKEPHYGTIIFRPSIVVVQNHFDLKVRRFPVFSSSNSYI